MSKNSLPTTSYLYYRSLISYLVIGLFLLNAILGLGLRLLNLSTVPASLYYDEMDYAITGEAINQFGTDLSGDWSVGQLRPVKTLNYTAELPAVFHALVQKIFGPGFTTAHYPAAIFGLLSIAMSMWLAKLVFNKRQVVLLVGVFSLLNPWHVHISRTGYEAVISLFFQLSFIVGLFLFIKEKSKLKVNILGLFMMLTSLVIGFYTYHATKFTFTSLTIASAFIIFSQRKLKPLSLIAVSLLVVLMSLLLGRSISLNQQGIFGQRQNETIFNLDHLSDEVNHQRQISLSSPVVSIFINKGTTVVDLLVRHYVAVFDVNRLFVTGYEGGFQFSLIVHGFFYISSLFLLCLGVYYLIAKISVKTAIFLALIVISPVASAISLSYQSIFRSSLTYSLLLIVIAVGADYLASRKFKYQSVVLPLILIIIFLEGLFFGFRYFHQYPILSADNHYFHEKLLAGYLSHLDQPVTIVSDSNVYSKARSYIFYNRAVEDLTLEERQQFADTDLETYHIGTVTFTSLCPEKIDQSSESAQIVEPGKYEVCEYELNSKVETMNFGKKSLSSPIDSRAYFFLINDSVCQDSNLPKSISIKQWSDFDVMSLSADELCQTWVKLE